MTLFPQHPFAGLDVRSLIDRQAERFAEKSFLIWEPFEGPMRTWSYGEFASEVRRFAAGLIVRGVQPGERIIVHLENCPETLISWLGCAYAGAVAVMTNTKSSPDELAFFVAHSKAVAAISHPALTDAIGDAFSACRWVALTGGQTVPHRDAISFESIGDDPGLLQDRPHDPMAPFAIQYTSGTTSRPKAVLWTHGNFLWGASVSAMHEDLRADDVHLVHLPLFHTNAQIYSVAASMWVGGTVVLMPRFSASRFWEISIRHRCTWASMVQFCMKAIAPQPVPDHHYRFWGAGICEPPADSHFRVKTLGWWGMTETITHGTIGSPHFRDASMSMGRASPAYEIHVLGDDGKAVKPGETGDLYVRGQRGVSLFLEYAEDPAATAAAFRDDGLFITGDRVRLSEDGMMYFADRTKDMLKVGGENVAASEVERVIAMVDGVAEVAVVGRPDAMLQEVPVAFVIARTNDDATLEARIVQECEVKLASFKRPRAIRFVDDLPRATLGKVAKATLRDMLAACD